MNIESLADYGIDYEKGLRNCIGDEKFYKKVMAMFLEEKCFSYAKSAYEKGDKQELFTRMHELKGISGNIAITDLYEATIPLVELVRTEGDTWNKTEIDRLFATCEAAYNRAYEGIEKFLAE